MLSIYLPVHPAFSISPVDITSKVRVDGVDKKAVVI